MIVIPKNIVRCKNKQKINKNKANRIYFEFNACFTVNI